MWQQIDSSLDCLCRNLYGAMLSDAQPIKSIISVEMVILINGDYRAHHMWLLQTAVYEYY